MGYLLSSDMPLALSLFLLFSVFLGSIFHRLSRQPDYQFMSCRISYLPQFFSETWSPGRSPKEGALTWRDTQKTAPANVSYTNLTLEVAVLHATVDYLLINVIFKHPLYCPEFDMLVPLSQTWTVPHCRYVRGLKVFFHGVVRGCRRLPTHPHTHPHPHPTHTHPYLSRHSKRGHNIHTCV